MEQMPLQLLIDSKILYGIVKVYSCSYSGF